MAERGPVLAAEALGGKGPGPFPPGTAGSMMWPCQGQKS